MSARTTKPCVWLTCGTSDWALLYPGGNARNGGTGGSMNSGFAKCSVGSTGKKCGCRISFCQVMRVGMFLTFSKIEPGVLRTKLCRRRARDLDLAAVGENVGLGESGGQELRQRLGDVDRVVVANDLAVLKDHRGRENTRDRQLVHELRDRRRVQGNLAGRRVTHRSRDRDGGFVPPPSSLSETTAREQRQQPRCHTHMRKPTGSCHCKPSARVRQLITPTAVS
jgi:hypothetical protein